MTDALPTVGDIIQTEQGDVCVLAVDLEECIWTCVTRITQDIVLLWFDENKNYAILAPCFDEIDWDDR